MRVNGDTTDLLEISENFEFSDVVYTQEILNEQCALSTMINAELKCIDETERRQAVILEEKKKLKKLTSELFELSKQSSMIIYHARQSTVNVIGGKLKLSVKNLSCPQQYNSFYQKVDENSWSKICIDSVKQSETSVWYKQRYLRITASSRAHRIKTRVDDFEKLAQQFKKTKYKGALTDAMRWGLNNESKAKQKFTDTTKQEIWDVGLVIHLSQPFLAASPDGIIQGPNGFELLEVKCPYTCKETKIIGCVYGKKISYVDYLEINDADEAELKKSHQYYTQIQFSLYVLSIENCNFFVYSPKDYVLVRVERNEQFLSSLIPKIENFYFHYFLPVLLTDQ